MSYVVLARKWRPTQFDDVVGQSHVARTLKNAIEQDRVHHAFLFTGARGVGKTSTARILAKALNCEKGPTPTPCGECSSCVEVTAGQAVDVFEIDGASNRGINEIRELRESVRYAPSRDRYKIYIIDEVHMLTTEAFNALLKTLEEPPPHAKFVFATTEPQKIPVTILSRCQRYDFKRIGQSDIVDHLASLCESEGIDAERPALQIIARQAAGGMRDALSILDQIISFSGERVSEEDVNSILGVANRKHLFELSRAVLAGDVEESLLVLDEINRYGYDLQQFSSELVTHFRDLMVVRVVDDPRSVTHLTDTEVADAKAQVDGLEPGLLHRFFEVMAAGAQEMRRSSFPKLIFEMTLVRMARLEPLVGLDLMVDRLAALEEAFDGEPLPGPTSPAQSDASRRAEAQLEKKKKPEPEARDRDETRQREVVSRDEPALTPRGVADETRAVEKPENSEAREKVGRSDASIESADSDRGEPRTEPDVGRKPGGEAPEETDDGPGADEKSDEKSESEPEPRVEPQSDSEADLDVDSDALPDRLSIAEYESLSASERWHRLVDSIRFISQPVAATCEHGYVESFEDNVVELSFSDKYLDILRDGRRLELVERVLKALFGPAWSIQVHSRDEASETSQSRRRTIAGQREAARDQKRDALRQELLTHPAVQQAQDLFEVDPDSVRVQVKLFDDP